jgi:hypothetical protein
MRPPLNNPHFSKGRTMKIFGTTFETVVDENGRKKARVDGPLAGAVLLSPLAAAFASAGSASSSTDPSHPQRSPKGISVLKKTVTYINPFTETEVTEDLYFNLTEAEIIQTAMAEGEGWADSLQRLSTATDGKQIITEFNKLLGMAYGRREGNRHVKSPEITQEFLSSEAYSTLFLDLISSPGSGAEFFSALMPKNMDKIAREGQGESRSRGSGRRYAGLDPGEPGTDRR